MGASLGERLNVVYLLCRSDPPGFLAQFAERVFGGKAGSDTMPRSTVAFAGLGVAPVLFILAGILFGVVITKAPVHQLGTAGVSAGFLWFVWHGVLLSGVIKALAGRPREGFVRDITLSIIIVSAPFR